MSTKSNDSEFLRKELDAIRERLEGTISDAELNTMQVRMNIVKSWARIAGPAHDHHHDNNDHHDHDQGMSLA